MKNIRITKNPFLLFSPFLILYVLLVLIFPTHGIVGDEDRYLMFAQNLIHGFYSPPPPGIDIGDGPGYPILIAPFLALGLPLICITLLNAVFYYLSIVLLFKSLQQVVSFPIALIFSIFWACFYNSYESIPLILSEIFISFLVSLLLFNIFRAFNTVNFKKAKKYIYLSGFIIGFIALTKVIFGYVILVMLIGSGLLWIMNRKIENYRRALIVLSIALITTLPYLLYTYHISDRIFYWGTSGGNNLYWMSSPYEGEFGSWIEYPFVPNSKKNTITGTEDTITSRHQKDFKKILKYQGVERDDAYKIIAINNIKSHPGKYIQNCISNVGRMLFNYPYSYEIQKPRTLLRLPLNGILVVFLLFCLMPTLINWRKVIFPIRFLLFFVLIYMGGSVFASAETRMFTKIVPLLLFWIAYIIQRSMKVKLEF